MKSIDYAVVDLDYWINNYKKYYKIIPDIVKWAESIQSGNSIKMEFYGNLKKNVNLEMQIASIQGIYHHCNPAYETEKMVLDRIYQICIDDHCAKIYLVSGDRQLKSAVEFLTDVYSVSFEYFCVKYAPTIQSAFVDTISELPNRHELSRGYQQMILRNFYRIDFETRKKIAPTFGTVYHWFVQNYNAPANQIRVQLQWLIDNGYLIETPTLRNGTPIKVLNADWTKITRDQLYYLPQEALTNSRVYRIL